MKRIFTASLVAAAVLSLGTTAHANTVSVYTSATDYATAGGVGIAYSFPAIAGTQSCPGLYSYVSGNENLNGGDGFCVFNDGYYGSQEYIGFGDDFDGATSVSIDPAAGNLGDSLSFYLGSFFSPQVVGISVNGAAALDFNIPMAPADQFFGIASTDPITDVTITYSQELDIPTLPNGATPEPSSFILFGSGALTMAVAVRRRRIKRQELVEIHI